MCLKRTTLVKSHFMPAALYAYCRDGSKCPIAVASGAVYPTDRQTWSYLLCSKCEDILNKGGESWVADKLASWEHAFYYREGSTSLYFGAAAPGLKVDKLAHFALGIFWKASVHSWSASGKEPRIELGLYSSAIRDWLLTGGKFPEHLSLIVNVFSPSQAQVAMNDPYEGTRTGGYRNYFFHVPGVLFLLAVGKSLDAVMKSLCICNPGAPISVCDVLAGKFVQVLVREVQGSRTTKAYRQYEAKHKR
jgi:hypothetical protein